MSIKAMKIALEALEWEAEGWQCVQPITREAIAVLRERLAQPEQEPVAWMHNLIEGNVITHRPADIDRHPERWTALYTAPPRREWQGLTDEELAEFSELKLGAYDLCLEVEAKLQEKNT